MAGLPDDELPDPESLFPPDLPDEVRLFRAQHWIPVNLLFPLKFGPETKDMEYLALKHQLLPRVPAQGEWIEIPRHYQPVEAVRWGADGKVLVRLRMATVEAGYLDELQAAGWTTFPRYDADEWFFDQADERG